MVELARFVMEECTEDPPIWEVWPLMATGGAEPRGGATKLLGWPPWLLSCPPGPGIGLPPARPEPEWVRSQVA